MPALTGYLALGTLSAAGVFTELSGLGSYARQAITLTPDAGGQAVNAAAITFPDNGATPWPVFSAYAIFPAASGGTPLFAWSNGRTRSRQNGAFVIGAGVIKLEFPAVRAVLDGGALVVVGQPWLWSPDGLRPAFVTLTQAAYDALATKDASTLYVING